MNWMKFFHSNSRTLVLVPFYLVDLPFSQLAWTENNFHAKRSMILYIVWRRILTLLLVLEYHTSSHVSWKVGRVILNGEWPHTLRQDWWLVRYSPLIFSTSNSRTYTHTCIFIACGYTPELWLLCYWIFWWARRAKNRRWKFDRKNWTTELWFNRSKELFIENRNEQIDQSLICIWWL